MRYMVQWLDRLHARTCTYQEVRNTNFSKYFAYILNGWSQPEWNLNTKSLINLNVEFLKIVMNRFNYHYVKSVRIRSYCGLHFPAFGSNKERICLYSVRMRKNADQTNDEYKHFLRSVLLHRGHTVVTINNLTDFR